MQSLKLQNYYKKMGNYPVMLALAEVFKFTLLLIA